MSKCIVIGGGAAGMIAAYSAAKNGHRVILAEKNEKLGKKVFITGKGRCNITNACEIEDLFKNIVTNPKFMYSSIYQFDNHAIIELLHTFGCMTKVERGDRVFPVSDHASDVISSLTRALKSVGVDIRLHTEIKEICLKEKKESVDEFDTDHMYSDIIGVKTKTGEFFDADAVIVCTGGVSYASTGSTGDGYRFAKRLGLEVEEQRPALVPLECEEDWCKELMGLALKNVEVSLTDGKKVIFREFGEMLFTHFGVTGPIILSASSFYAKKHYGQRLALSIDLKPALSYEQLDKRIIREFDENINKQFKNAVNNLFPAKLIPVMIRLSGIDSEKKVNEISKEERLNFVKLIKNLTLTVTGTRSFVEAIITKGGVSVKEINPSTMESKKIKGLYFAGEVLDVDALTGGFNLQIAWSTGYLAGESVR